MKEGLSKKNNEWPYELYVENTETNFMKTYDVLSQHKNANEFEARFGEFSESAFIPGVKAEVFKQCLRAISKLPNYETCDDSELLKIILPDADGAIIQISGRSAIEQFIRTSTGKINQPKTNQMFMSLEKYEAINPEVSMNLNAYRKHKIGKPYDNKQYAYRLSIAHEKQLSIQEKQNIDIVNSPKLFRYMQRYSFLTGYIHNDTRFRYDFSIVKSTKIPAISFSDSRVQTAMTSQSYEIEIEYIRETSFPVAEPTQNSNIQRPANLWINQMHDHIYILTKLIRETDFPLTRDHADSIRDDYCTLFHKFSQNNQERANMIRQRPERYFLGAMPVSLTLENVIHTIVDQKTSDSYKKTNIRQSYPHDYTVTEKADGERRLMMVSSNQFIYLIARDLSVTFTGLSSRRIGTLIDGEWLKDQHKYLAFDLLFLDSKDIRNLMLKSSKYDLPSTATDDSRGRINHLEKLLLSDDTFSKVYEPCVNISCKRHWVDVDVVAQAGLLWKNRFENFRYNIDGIFFTPRNAPYPRTELGSSTWHGCLKWKPRSLLSIDFQIFVRGVPKLAKASESDVLKPYVIIHLYVQRMLPRHHQNRGKAFQASHDRRAMTTPFEPHLLISRTLDPFIARLWVDSNQKMLAIDPLTGSKRAFKNGDIVEFVYNKNSLPGFEWCPIRLREDKVVPNSFNTANEVWNAIHEANGMISDESLFDFLKDRSSDSLLENAAKLKKSQYYSIRESLQERKQSEVAQLRNFHNLIKRQLYVSTSLRIQKMNEMDTVSALLDLGCGRGGDYSKYRDASIRQVIGIDLDKMGLDRLIHEFHDRYSGSNLNPRVVTTFQADMTKLLSCGIAATQQQDRKRLLDFFDRNGTGFFPMVSCQFAMHYAFNNELSLRAFMMNIYENLSIGGYFIATTFDGQKVFDAIQNSKDGVLEFKLMNTPPFGAIRKNFNESRLLPFGQSIQVMFQSISEDFKDEFLVNFSYFQKTMTEDYDIKPISDFEAKEMGFPKASTTFDVLYNDKGFARHSKHYPQLTEPEKLWSFLYRYLILKKVGSGNAAVIQTWLNKLKR